MVLCTVGRWESAMHPKGTRTRLEGAMHRIAGLVHSTIDGKKNRSRWAGNDLMKFGLWAQSGLLTLLWHSQSLLNVGFENAENRFVTLN
jgi:hypothetical protein